MSSPSLLPFLFLAAILHPTAALPGDHLAVSDFVSEELPFLQDWSITYGVPGLADKAAAAAAAGNVVLSREGAGGVVDGLKGSDTGNYKWYFTSPQSFFDFDTTSAYNGVIQWRLQSLSWLESFTASPPPDIILTCSPKSLTLMAKGIVTDRFGGKMFSLPLNETANWFFLKPSGRGAQPTRAEFVECLAGLQSVSVRGGYYNGAEKTVLKHVKIIEGVVDATPTTFNATASDIVSSAAVGNVGREYRAHWNRPGNCNVASARISVAQTASIDLCPQPVGTWPGTDDLLYPRGPWLKTPFVQPFAFKALPPICTSARLVVGVVGRASQRLTLGPNNYVTVYAGTDTAVPLGRLFNNRNALLNEERNVFELSDSLVVAAVHMAGMTAGGGQVVFSLRSSPGIDFEFKIVSAELRWKQGTCMSMLLTSTARFEDAIFKGPSSAVGARSLDADNLELLFKMPPSISRQISGDGVVLLMAEGDTGPSHYIDVLDTSDRTFGSMFKDQQVTSQSAVIWSGRAKAISPTPSTVFTLEGVSQQEDKVVGAYLRVSELWESGGGQERKIVAWNAAAGMATLQSEWDARNVPTLQTKLEIVRVSYFFLQSNVSAPVRVPLQFRKQWLHLPRSFASSSSNGDLTLRFRVVSTASLLSRVRVPVARVVFPLVGGYIDVLRPGSSGLLGIALARPSYETFRFNAPPKPPLGSGVIIAEIFFQDHEQLVTRSASNTKTDRGDDVDVGEVMGLGQGLPLAPQQLYPHGYSAVRILAGDRGESVGFFLSDDYSQYEPSLPFISYVHVSQSVLSALAAAGDLHFTLVIPPGTGVIRVVSLAISYPA